MLASLAELRAYTDPADIQTLDSLITKATTRRQERTERLARDCMARAPQDEEPQVPRRPEHDRMAVGELLDD